MTKTFKDPRAVELCNEIRYLYSICPGDGWVARPHHGKKQIRIGHPDFGVDDAVTSQVLALHMALDRLGLAKNIGYTLALPPYDDAS